MKTEKAIHLAGGTTALASLLGITPGAVSQWGEEIPDGREWQLRVIQPEWFGTAGDDQDPSSTKKSEPAHVTQGA
jgi:hypothetical protein